mmetsp:Transcript_38909/g.59122  ORF Transcript_38909/g.59122 Transcript_38909/m.59122 type:complete len:144 (+) Transcript_38909:1887-2318(+)
MALPLYSWDYWSVATEKFVPKKNEPTRDMPLPKRAFWKENFYIFEKSKSVLNMKLSLPASPEAAPVGITTFINEAFGKNFKEHSDSLIDDGTIEMQYDFNCEVTEYLVVADVHGELPASEIAPFGLIFDQIILHVSEGEESLS